MQFNQFWFNIITSRFIFNPEVMKLEWLAGFDSYTQETWSAAEQLKKSKRHVHLLHDVVWKEYDLKVIAMQWQSKLMDRACMFCTHIYVWKINYVIT